MLWSIEAFITLVEVFPRKAFHGPFMFNTSAVGDKDECTDPRARVLSTRVSTTRNILWLHRLYYNLCLRRVSMFSPK